jgi:hypothetical protein
MAKFDQHDLTAAVGLVLVAIGFGLAWLPLGLIALGLGVAAVGYLGSVAEAMAQQPRPGQPEQEAEGQGRAA